MLEYQGFAVVPEGRQYSFRLARKDTDRGFTLVVSNASFRTGLLHYQDAPEVCYRKLAADLASEDAVTPVSSHQQVTESEITLYQASGKAHARVPTQEQRQQAKERRKASVNAHL